MLLWRLEQTVNAVRRVASGETGELHLGYPYGGLYTTILELARVFRRERPHAGLVLRQLSAGMEIRALLEREVDVVISRVSQPLTDIAGLVVAPLCEELLMVMLPANHTLATGGPVALGDLADEPFVMFPARTEPMIASRHLAACEAAGFAPRIAHDPLDAQTQALMVAAGLGVALTGDGLALRFPGVAYVAVDPPIPITEIAAVWPEASPSPLLEPVLAALGVATG